MHTPSAFIEKDLLTLQQQMLATRLPSPYWSHRAIKGCWPVMCRCCLSRINATAIQLYERIAERPGFIQFRKTLS